MQKEECKETATLKPYIKEMLDSLRYIFGKCGDGREPLATQNYYPSTMMHGLFEDKDTSLFIADVKPS